MRTNTTTNKVIKQIKNYDYVCDVEVLKKGSRTGVNIFIPIDSKLAIDITEKITSPNSNARGKYE